MKIHSVVPNPETKILQNEAEHKKTKLVTILLSPGILNNFLAMLPFSLVLFVDTILAYYPRVSQESFLYPCYYTNMVSINETAQMSSIFSSMPQNNVQSDDSLSLSNDNVTKEFKYHQDQWKKCFNQNLNKFDQKIAPFQMFFIIIGFTVTLYQICRAFYYFLNLKYSNLTKEERKAYEKQWHAYGPNKLLVFCKCVVLCLYPLYWPY